MLVDDDQRSFGIALEDLRDAGKGDIHLQAFAVRHDSNEGKVKPIAGNGEISPEELYLDGAQFGADRRLRAKKLALAAHPHQTRGFGAPAVAGKAGCCRQIPLLKISLLLRGERAPEFLDFGTYLIIRNLIHPQLPGIVRTGGKAPLASTFGFAAELKCSCTIFSPPRGSSWKICVARPKSVCCCLRPPSAIGLVV